MRKIYTLLLTLVSVIASAQYNFTVYNTSNSGIVSNSINDIKIDSNGLLWIASPAGVSAFNGTTFTNYTTGNSGIVSNAITEIEIDGLGRKWMASQNNGIILLNGTTWTNYTISNSNIPSNAIRNIAVDSANNLWVTTIGALAKFNGTTWTIYSSLPNINSLEIDSSDGVWVTNNGVLYKFNGTDFTFIGQNVEKLLDISAGTIYVDGSNGGEMFTYSTLGTLLSTYNSNSCLAGNQPNALDVDNNNQAWIAFDGSGLQNFSDCATYTTTNSGLPNNTLTVVRTQNPSTIWLGNLQQGLIKATPQNATGCWQEISAGFEYSVGIKTDGTLWAWGQDVDSQLGDGAVIARNAAVQIGTATNWKTVSAGYNHTLAIKTDGTLWAWGNNSNSQLGDGTTTARLAPIQIGTATNWKSVSAGSSHSLAIRTNGSLFAWGYNYDGQLGDGSTIQRSTPWSIGTATNWVKVAAGRAHSAGIKADGTLWTWGNNTRGELGNGTNVETIYDVSPKQVGTATNWLKLTVGSYHTLAIKSNGTLWGWGDNQYGQLGNATTSNSLSPVQIGSASNWSSVDGGHSHSLGIKTNGTLWSWGVNSEGELGNGTSGTTNTTSPVQVGTTTNSMLVAAGQYHSLEVNFSGSLRASGFNSNGQLGDNTLIQKNSFTAVVCPSNCSTPTQPSAANVTASTATLSWTAATPAPASGYMYAYSTNPIIGGTNGTTLSTTVNLTNLSPGATYYFWVASHCGVSQSNWIPGGSFTTLAAAGCWSIVSGGSDYAIGIKTDGTTWAWGNNEFGQLGDGTTTNKVIPTQIGISNVWKIAAGVNHTLAIKLDGTLWAWGNNEQGQLGNGNTTNKSTPVKIGTATDWQNVAVGEYFTLAVKANGTLWAWGDNYYGQFGNGNTSDSTTPLQIGTVTTWKSVTAGDNHSLAIRTDGTLWGWGENYSGQVGDQSTTNRTTPVQVAFGTIWKSIDAGGTHSLGIKTDNTLWAWGTNFSGELGTGGSSRTYPGQVGTANTWRVAEIGDFSSAGIKDNQLWTWGANSGGQLGDGTAVNRNVPTLIGTATDRLSISVGKYNTYVISTNANLFGTGYNTSGQIGDGTQVNRNTFTLISCTAVLSNEDFTLDALKIYPNPVKDLLNLSFSEEISTVSLYNLLGQQVMVKTVNSNEAALEVSNLASGAYIVKVNTSEGTVFNKKIIKQ